MKAPAFPPVSFRSALLAALLLTPATPLLAQQPPAPAPAPAPVAPRSAPTPPPAPRPQFTSPIDGTPVPGLPAAPQVEADPANSGESITREIEQRVLLKQCQAASEALVELAQAATDNSGPVEAKRIETAVSRNAAWLARLQQDLKNAAADPDEVQDELNSSAGALNEAAWQMLTSGDDPAASHPQLALQLATSAVALLATEDPEQRPRFLDTRARALFMTGQHDQAIAVEQQALAACEADNETLKAGLQATLASYQKGQLPAADQDAGSGPEFPEAPDSSTATGISADGPDADQLNAIAWDLLTSTDSSAPHNPAAALQLGTLALGLCDEDSDSASAVRILDTCARALFLLGSRDEALTLQKKAVSLCKDDDELKQELQTTLAAYEKGAIAPAANPLSTPLASHASYLNEAAWALLTAEDSGERKPDVALKLATVAVDIAAKDSAEYPMILDTRARALFMTGQHAPAIATEKAAVAASPEGSAMKEKFTAFLSAYQQGQLPGADQ